MEPSTIIGIHLSGANTPRTAVVQLLESSGLSSKIKAIYERIGSVGSVFSDDRLLQIISQESDSAQIVIDCPLTLPPCVRCQLPTCPGQIQCPDVNVAMMLKASRKTLSSQGSKRRKNINPQSQRLFDVWGHETTEQISGKKHTLKFQSYNNNMIPLVFRAQALQKRLFHMSPKLKLKLKETSVSLALEELNSFLKLTTPLNTKIQDFDHGMDYRKKWITAINHQLKIESDEVNSRKIIENADVFKAYITAVLGLLISKNQILERPKEFSKDEGWVYLPNASI